MEKLGQGCWAQSGIASTLMAARRKTQMRLSISTSRSGRNRGCGCPLEAREEPWDRPPIVFELGAVLVQEFALLKRCENLIQQDVQKCQQKNRLGSGEERHAQNHEHVEQVAGVPNASIDSRPYDSAQAMLRVQFGQTHKALPPKGVPSLGIE